MTRTRVLLGHVRAASPGLPVTDLNCHPFKSGALSFMHNGDLGGFQTLRRRLLRDLSDEAFSSIEGSTDSEHLFAILLDHLRDLDDGKPTGADRLGAALERTIGTAEALQRAHAPGEKAYLNLAVSDGASAAVSRYSTGDSIDSLYYSAGRVYHCDRGLCHMDTDVERPTAVIVASEPLDDDGTWTAVGRGDLVLVSPDLEVRTRPIDPEAGRR